MIIIRDTMEVNLLTVSKTINCMNIDKLSIFSINMSNMSDKVNTIKIREPSAILYMEIGLGKFIEIINGPKADFMEYNYHSLYILRNGSYKDIKNILTRVNGCNTNLGRGGSQKAHILSPLDFRLSCYLLAMFNFNYKLINDLNTFNHLSKDRYLPYIERPLIRFLATDTSSNTVSEKYKPITVDKMPLYSNDNNLEEYKCFCKEVKDIKVNV